MSQPSLTLSLASDPVLDAERRRGLRQMRLVALSLLVFAAVVFLATLRVKDQGFWGFVNAGAEASMVGAMADWFAVTALFRHPLGLPIPHTALIPRRKDMLAQSLQDFMGENFLREDIIRDRVLSAQISDRLANWLLDPANARRVVDEASHMTTLGLERMRDEAVAEIVEEAVIPRLREEPISPIAGSLLGEVVRDKAHYGLVDLALGEFHRWLTENPETFARVLAERAPWWAPHQVNDLVITRMHKEALKWVSEIRENPTHQARIALDDLLADLADDLLHDEATIERAERLKVRILDHPQLMETVLSLWRAFRSALIAALADPEGPLRTRIQSEVERFAQRVVAEQDLRARLDGYVADLAAFAVNRYGTELTAVISHTINRWDGKETASRVELFVGRDLQFIRINGTIVGGLVGLVIHAVVVLIG
ncbi:MAG TPA: DUF445 domain-containing protein [Lapillicoccus sp.]|uniref:DUF445 domain-containing protein n=1 Tax=Lapillicoccus sp. TaxID=1909287 RepID=UPI002F93E80C